MTRLWAITSYFNPAGFRTRRANYTTFRKALRVPLVAVEWSTDGRFELGPSDADILIQRTSPDVLWQKERLLNIGLHALPKEAEFVAWLDCDVVFGRADWWVAAAHELQTHPIAQLFSRCIFPEPLATGDVVAAPSLVHASREPASEDVRFQRLWGRPPAGPPRRDRLAGLAWAGRREVLERHRLYDASVFGAGDRALACAAFGQQRHAEQAWLRTPRQRRHYLAWADAFSSEVAGHVGLVDGQLEHLWHGSLGDRQHGVRHRHAEEHAFDPEVDIGIDPTSGLWRWASPKRELHQAVAGFFDRRHEDAASG